MGVMWNITSKLKKANYIVYIWIMLFLWFEFRQRNFEEASSEERFTFSFKINSCQFYHSTGLIIYKGNMKLVFWFVQICHCPLKVHEYKIMLEWVVKCSHKLFLVTSTFHTVKMLHSYLFMFMTELWIRELNQLALWVWIPYFLIGHLFLHKS